MRFSFTPGRDWHPLHTRRCYSRPDEGRLIAHQHAVWKVVRIEDTDLTEADREVWVDHGMPNLADWRQRPYRITVEWEGGVKPDWAERTDGSRRHAGIDIPAGSWKTWNVYADGRWPQCSCCGEPMPCRAALEDEQVNTSLDRIAKLEAIPSGACWACSEPITTRQKSVAYPGDNIDLPGGQQPHFHTRQHCRGSAERYEAKWLAADPRRERILTWPKCDGILIVHADGSSECASDRDPIGRQRESQPDCRGHLTHDHSVQTACFAHGNYLSPAAWGDASCPRGCKRSEHRGIGARSRRPERRQPTTRDLFR